MTGNDGNLYVPVDKLGKFGENTADAIALNGRIRGASVAGEMMSCLREIKGSHHRAAAVAAGEKAGVSGAMEWLLDNWYIAEREGKEAAAQFRAARRLRGTGEGDAFVLALARALVRSGQGEVTPERIRAFMDGAQRGKALDEREISLLVPALRAALVDYLCRLCRSLFREDTGDLAERMGALFSSLRLLSSLDMTDILDEISLVERTLSDDPAGVYDRMDDRTKGRYRSQVSRLARKHGLEEHQVAARVLELSRRGEGREAHVGYFLFSRPLGNTPRRRGGGLYIGGILLASLFFALLAAIVLDNALVAFLLVVPISEIVKNLADFLVIKLVRPQHVHRLRLEGGIPPEGRTLCVISALLDSEQSGKTHAARLEEYYLANRDCGDGLLFGILADFPESESPELEDVGAWIDSASAELEGLNRKYGGRFMLLYRERTYHEKSGRYMGWERKRGAILELTRLLTGGESSLIVTAGTRLQLQGVRYVITLDSDTRLNVGAAREMIGAMLHPLNTPVIDERRGVVREGAALMQPRIGVDLRAAGRSDFTRIFAGQGGIDPYGSAASDVYQDLFGEGSYTGKGIFDVKAFSRCLDGAFPENTILSHDLLEGAYLHAAYLGDVELTDGHPYKVLSYYGRMHRWTRGDWQSAPWLFGRVRDASGERVKNPLSEVSRFKVFDNLRRSMVPVFTMLALLIAMFISARSLFWAGVVAVLSPVSGLLISSAELVLRRDPGTRARYHSTIISGFAGGFLETMSLLILLPYHAYICLSGAVTALWRMLVTKKNMLSWVTAADMERRTGTGVLHYYYKMLPAAVIALAVIFLSGSAPEIAVGIVWLLSPLYAMSISRERGESRQITDSQRNYLQNAAGDIWRYFEDFLTPEDHFLPPDNWQEQPAVGLAHRTSPTNIGLALLSCLAAMDLELGPRTRALGYIENILATVERMEKWEGHLLNWYDTRTLRPLHPRYVSAVDSGNLSGCLLTLREGLYEMGQRELAERADKLYQDMGFGRLYDRKRGLFHIGWDLERDEPTEGWYDLMASEARQTSYIAIARGDVGPRHWRRLGRALVSQDNYSGMVSWTGTMFEYMMPALLMPCYKNSLLYESLKFCVYVQKKRHTPWGISESAFYAFDPALGYSYKAHGVQRLALKRGLNKEIVVSPYSSFLALPVDLRGAVGNLRRLEAMGAKGRYGFYEALDFTPNRQSGRGHEVVRTYMAHHLGMSLLSIDNALRDGVMQERFMRDRAMSAYRELLQEKVPVGQIVLRQPPREVPDKPRRVGGAGWSVEERGVDVFRPASTVLSNGAYSVVVSESGHSRSMAGEQLVTRFQPRPDGPPQGISFYLKIAGEIYPLQAAPDYDPGVEHRHTFTGGEAVLETRRQTWESRVSISVPRGELGEGRRILIRNTGQETLSGELICYFEPVLAPSADYFAHPAFSKLGLETGCEDTVLVIRRRSNGVRPEGYLVFCADEPFAFDTAREAALGRSGLMAALAGQPGNTQGTVLDPCVLARLPVTIRPGGDRLVSFSLAAGEKREETVLAARRIAAEPIDQGVSFVEAKAMGLGMEAGELTAAMDMVAELIYPFAGARERGRFITPESGGQRDLWPFGVSGDLPVVTAKIGGEDGLELAERLIRRHSLLHMCGVKFDLVFLVGDGGDYRRPVHSGLRDTLTAMGLERFQGARGGIHLVDDGESCAAILAASVRIIDGEEGAAPRITDGEMPRAEGGGVRVGLRPVFYYDEEGSAVFETRGALPPNTWSNLLTNGRYGYIATDSGTGHMWRLNARENKMTPWLNDTLTTRGAERLTLLREGREISLFADADGLACTVTYGFGFARWVKAVDGGEITTTAFVPRDADARVFLVEGDLREGDRVGYFAELVLGADERSQAFVVTGTDGDALTAQNGSTGEFPGQTLRLTASRPPLGFTCDRGAWARRSLDRAAGPGLDPCFYAVYPGGEPLVIVTGTENMAGLLPLAGEADARAALRETADWWRARVGPVRVTTPDETLNRYLSGWAVYQSLACRVMGRSSVYQCGGAYGFRDQLQDVAALIPLMPEQARRQLHLAAAHQFVEGDVQHWWHPSGVEGMADKGVRTRCSDDLLWLPYVLCEYVEKTGDTEICGEEAPYLHSPPLAPGEHERYELPEQSGTAEPLLDHALRAIDLVLRRGAGSHGLALMGTGDWNDGMNLVGAEGRGESVWLTWFLTHVLERFSALCTRLGRGEAAARYGAEARRFGRAADSAWDGGWYLRGYYDNGRTLGGRDDRECQIDAIAQGFSALTGQANPQRVQTALRSAIDRLYDRETGIVRLFDPPFVVGENNPGYIRGYAPGLRENGGQYTHGALWLAMGALKSGMAEAGWAMLRDMLPGHHDPEEYRGEPYVLAADVYGNEQNAGRAGWTWYTGAAGWYYRVAMEDLLGLRLRDGRLYIEPNLPADIPGYSVEWTAGERTWRIQVEKDVEYRITVDGAPYNGGGIPLMGKTEINSL